MSHLWEGFTKYAVCDIPDHIPGSVGKDKMSMSRDNSRVISPPALVFIDCPGNQLSISFIKSFPPKQRAGRKPGHFFSVDILQICTLWTLHGINTQLFIDFLIWSKNVALKFYYVYNICMYTIVRFMLTSTH